MRYAQRLAVPLFAVLATWSLAACQAAPSTTATPAAASSSTTKATGAPAGATPNDTLARILAARDSADSVASAAAAVKAAADLQREMREWLSSTIHFDPDSARVRLDARLPLDRMVPLLAVNPDVTLRITGHAYEQGSAQANTALGKARADSAKRYMVIQGVPADRIETAGHAETAPAGASPTALMNLRRAEFEIVKSPTTLKSPR